MTDRSRPGGNRNPETSGVTVAPSDRSDGPARRPPRREGTARPTAPSSDRVARPRRRSPPAPGSCPEMDPGRDHALHPQGSSRCSARRTRSRPVRVRGGALREGSGRVATCQGTRPSCRHRPRDVGTVRLPPRAVAGGAAGAPHLSTSHRHDRSHGRRDGLSAGAGQGRRDRQDLGGVQRTRRVERGRGRAPCRVRQLAARAGERERAWLVIKPGRSWPIRPRACSADGRWRPASPRPTGSGHRQAHSCSRFGTPIPTCRGWASTTTSSPDVVPVALWDPDDTLADSPPDQNTRVWVTGVVQRRVLDGPEGRRSRIEVIADQVVVLDRAA
jgi:hypothetical protein